MTVSSGATATAPFGCTATAAAPAGTATGQLPPGSSAAARSLREGDGGVRETSRARRPSVHGVQAGSRDWMQGREQSTVRHRAMCGVPALPLSRTHSGLTHLAR